MKKLETKVEALERQNASLRVQLRMNSKNSHKPPSTDNFPKKVAIPVVKGKQQGSQKGQKGNTIKIVQIY